jgi:DNA-binding NarL/FixJ family response regulator
MTMMLVEDDFTCRCWLRGLAKKLGFTVVAEASNGQEAVAAATRTQPDFVLLDVSMPVLTGPQALPAILAAHPAARVVMLTSIADQATVVECLEKGAVGYIRKDSTVEEITKLLTDLRAELAAPQPQGEAHAG